MSRILLDTSAYSAWKRGHNAIHRDLQGAIRIAVNPVVLGELTAGFLGGRREDQNRVELLRFLDSRRVRNFPIDQETSERYAIMVQTLRAQGSPIPTNDIWIAASAMQHGFRLMTTDRHYLMLPQVVVEHYAP